MNIEDLTTINQVIAFLEGTQRVAFEVADDKDSCVGSDRCETFQR